MPELPEVENFRRLLLPLISSKHPLHLERCSLEKAPPRKFITDDEKKERDVSAAIALLGETSQTGYTRMRETLMESFYLYGSYIAWVKYRFLPEGAYSLHRWLCPTANRPQLYILFF